MLNHLPELIFCAAAGKSVVDVAMNTGWKFGAQLPASSSYLPPMTFADQDWRDPQRDKYMEALARHRPKMATVLDWEHEGQFGEVMGWAEDATQFVETVIVIPKVHGSVDRIPNIIGGKPIRLGYSVPSPYGATTVPFREFGDRPVHLLGGSPRRQMILTRYLNVMSVDCNMQLSRAKIAQVWHPGDADSDSRFWPQLQEIGYSRIENPFLFSFEWSCRNIIAAWHQLYERPWSIWRSIEYKRLAWLFEPEKYRNRINEDGYILGTAAKRKAEPKIKKLESANGIARVEPTSAFGLSLFRAGRLMVIAGRGDTDFVKIPRCQIIVQDNLVHLLRDAVIGNSRSKWQSAISISSRTFTNLRRWAVDGGEQSAETYQHEDVCLSSFGSGVNQSIILIHAKGTGCYSINEVAGAMLGGAGAIERVQRVLALKESEIDVRLPINALRRAFGVRTWSTGK